MFKKIASLVLGFLMILPIVACNKGSSPVGPDGKPGGSISVICYEAGFGTKWLEEMAAQFESAFDVNVTVKKSYVQGELISLLNDNAQNDDVVMAIGSMFNAQNVGFLTDLSAVYNSVPEGNEKSIKDSMNPAIYNKLLTEDGKIYQMNWADPVCGIILNQTVLNKVFPQGYKVPNTTDQLIQLCDDIEGAYPFSLSTSVCYWDYLHWVWWAQYEGYDNYIDYYWGYYQKEQPDGTTVRTLAENGEVLEMPGRLESLKVAEKLLKKSNGYVHKYADSMSYQEAQIAFVGQGFGGEDMTECAMMVNGQWLENEVQSYLMTKPQDLVMIKTPVISSIVNTLENKNMSDETLSAVIDAIDAGKTSYEGVSENDFARIREARRMVYSATFDHCACIPAKSDNKPLAMEFLKFMASNLGQSIYANYLNGLTMPYGYDVGDNVSDFVASRYANFSDCIPICIDFSSPLVYRQGHTAYTTGEGAGLDGVLYQGMTAEEIIADTKVTLMASWDDIMLAAK